MSLVATTTLASDDAPPGLYRFIMSSPTLVVTPANTRATISETDVFIFMSVALQRLAISARDPAPRAARRSIPHQSARFSRDVFDLHGRLARQPVLLRVADHHHGPQPARHLVPRRGHFDLEVPVL